MKKTMDGWFCQTWSCVPNLSTLAFSVRGTFSPKSCGLFWMFLFANFANLLLCYFYREETLLATFPNKPYLFSLFFNGTVMNFNIWHSKWSLYVWDVALGCSAFSLCITHSDLGVNFLAILNVFHLWIFLLIVEWWTLISSTWLLFTLLISVKAIGVYCFCIKYI